MKPLFLSVIIPAYNEAKRLPKTILDIDRYLHTSSFATIPQGNGFSKYDYEIIVVNDGSKDNTAAVVKKFVELPVKNLRLIDTTENHGKGWVVRRGMVEAAGK